MGLNVIQVPSLVSSCLGWMICCKMDVGFLLWISSEFYYEFPRVVVSSMLNRLLLLLDITYYRRSTLATFDTFMLNN